MRKCKEEQRNKKGREEKERSEKTQQENEFLLSFFLSVPIS